MRTPICAVLFAVLALCETASAQPPVYQPYGAWRGRIRYVEGPWRTRTTIHWGNGVTPTGGQVLIHGLTAAENVLTNEGFQRTMTGFRDAEAIKRSEANFKMIDKALEDMTARNGTIRKSLQDPIPELSDKSLLEAWDLTPTKVTSLTLEATDDGPHVDRSRKFDELKEKMAELETIAIKLNESASKVVSYSEFVGGKHDELGLTAEEEEFLDQLNTFAKNVDGDLEIEEENDVPVLHRAPTDALQELILEYKNLENLRKSHRKIAEELPTLGQPFLDDTNDEVVEIAKYGIEAGEQAVAFDDEWKDLPELEKEMFEKTEDPGNAPSVPEPFKEAKNRLENTVKNIQYYASEVTRNGSFVAMDPGDAEVDDPGFLKEQVQFANKVVKSYHDLAVDDVVVESEPLGALQRARQRFDGLVELIGDAATQADLLEQEANKLDENVRKLDFVTDGIAKAERIRSAIVEWGKPPSAQ